MAVHRLHLVARRALRWGTVREPQALRLEVRATVIQAGKGLGALPEAKFHVLSTRDGKSVAICGRGGLDPATVVDAYKVPEHRRCRAAYCASVWRNLPARHP